MNTERPEKSVKKILETLAGLGYSDVETSSALSQIAPSVIGAAIEARGDSRR